MTFRAKSCPPGQDGRFFLKSEIEIIERKIYSYYYLYGLTFMTF